MGWNDGFDQLRCEAIDAVLEGGFRCVVLSFRPAMQLLWGGAGGPKTPPFRVIHHFAGRINIGSCCGHDDVGARLRVGKHYEQGVGVMKSSHWKLYPTMNH